MQRVISQPKPTPPPRCSPSWQAINTAAVHAIVNAERVRSGAVVAGSILQMPLDVGERAVVSGVTLVGSSGSGGHSAAVPPDTLVATVRLHRPATSARLVGDDDSYDGSDGSDEYDSDDGDGGSEFVTLAVGLGDLWWGHTLMGLSVADEWLPRLGLEPEHVWLDGEPRVLATARLFPIGTSADDSSMAIALTMLATETLGVGALLVGLERVSLSELAA